MSYYLSVSAIWLFSLLPFRVLYAFSDLVYFVVYYIIGYRKKVVFENLRKAFPEKKDSEISAIAKKFYRFHLSDLIVEISKIRYISKKQILKRVHFSNTKILHKYKDAGKSIIATIGHCGNWEWMAMNLALTSNFEINAVIKPFSDGKFDKFFDEKLRSRFTKGRLIHYKHAYRSIVKNKMNQSIYIFATDQAPAKNEIDYWTTFLNHDTAVYLGTEKIAKALDIPVVFFDIQRKKRGFYEVEIIDLTSNSSDSKPNEITENHVKTLDKYIRKNPYNWLWSHRRWKHSRGF